MVGEGPSDNHAIGWFDSSKMMPVRVNWFAAGPVRALIDLARHMVQPPGRQQASASVDGVSLRCDAQCANAVLYCQLRRTDLISYCCVCIVGNHGEVIAASVDDTAWFVLGSGVESQEASSVLKFRLAKAGFRAGRRAGGQAGSREDVALAMAMDG